MAMDAIDQVVMNSRLHYLGMAARVIEPLMKLAVLTCMDARIDVAALLGLRPAGLRPRVLEVCPRRRAVQQSPTPLSTKTPQAGKATTPSRPPPRQEIGGS